MIYIIVTITTAMLQKKIENDTLEIISFDTIKSLPTNLHMMRSGEYGIVLDALKI